MLGLIVLAVVAFAVMPKGPKEYMAFALAVAVGLALAGKQVRERFGTSFAQEDGKREESAESRLVLWSACLDTIQKNPVFGVGPDHMPLRMDQYGFKKGKEAHTMWLQIGAELGLPGMFLLMSYYGLCVVRLWPIALGKTAVSDPWLAYLARAVDCFTLRLRGLGPVREPQVPRDALLHRDGRSRCLDAIRSFLTTGTGFGILGHAIR